MKTYKVSDMVHKRRDMLADARKGPVIIERRESNGEVLESFMLIKEEHLKKATSTSTALDNFVEPSTVVKSAGQKHHVIRVDSDDCVGLGSVLTVGDRGSFIVVDKLGGNELLVRVRL